MRDNYFNIGNISDFHEVAAHQAKFAVSKLDEAKLIPIFWNENGQFKEIEKKFAIQNTSTNKIPMTDLTRYEVINHADGFNQVLDAVADMNEKTFIRLEDRDDIAGLYILFPEIKANDGEDGMMMGVKFGNTYRQKLAFGGQLFTWRVRCLNGSTYSTLFDTFSIKTYHSVNSIKSMKDGIESFIKEMLANSSKLEDIIEAATEDVITFKNYEEIKNTLQSVVKTEKAADQIKNLVPLKTNRWEIYNAITNYASHNDKVSPQTRDNLSKFAEKRVLANQNFAPIPVVA